MNNTLEKKLKAVNVELTALEQEAINRAIEEGEIYEQAEEYKLAITAFKKAQSLMKKKVHQGHDKQSIVETYIKQCKVKLAN